MWWRGLAALGGLLLAETGLWVWGLWPLSDSRFDWKPYYDELVAKQDCRGAVDVVGEAATLREQRAIEAMRDLAQANWCPEATRFYKPDTIRLFEKLLLEPPPDLAQLYPPREGWGPGWRGRWKALPYILRVETWLATAEATRKHRRVIGIAGAAWWIPRHLRCHFAVHVLPEASYARLRHIFASHGRPELALADWDNRTRRCLGPM